jgi:hypothetical protein
VARARRPRSSSRELALAAALVAAGCGTSSPVSKNGTGDDAAADARRPAWADNPFRDARETPSRDEQLALFLTSHGLELAAAPESEWVALDRRAALLVTIRNRGSKELRVVGERTHGVWPFTSSERARVVLHTAVKWASLAARIEQHDDSFDALDGDVAAGLGEELVVPAGGERTLRLELPLDLPSAVVAASVAVRPVVHPLALVFAGEPERVATLRFPEVRVGFAPFDVVAASRDDATLLPRALERSPASVVAAAVRRAERDGAATVDQLVLSLPGPTAAARRARCVALEWLTGERLGDSVERWRGWWESESGTRFAQGRR